MVNRFDESNFDAEVLQSDLPVFVDFYADWCGPCKMMSPVIDKLAEEYEGRIKVGKVNVDECGDLAQKYGIMSIPEIRHHEHPEHDLLQERPARRPRRRRDPEARYEG